MKNIYNSKRANSSRSKMFINIEAPNGRIYKYTEQNKNEAKERNRQINKRAGYLKASVMVRWGQIIEEMKTWTDWICQCSALVNNKIHFLKCARTRNILQDRFYLRPQKIPKEFMGSKNSMCSLNIVNGITITNGKIWKNKKHVKLNNIIQNRSNKKSQVRLVNTLRWRWTCLRVTVIDGAGKSPECWVPGSTFSVSALKENSSATILVENSEPLGKCLSREKLSALW